MKATAFFTFAVAAGTSAKEIPANLKSFYDIHKSGTCTNKLSEAFTDGLSDTKDVFYCGDSSGAVYLKGPSGSYADMDIDCDGANGTEGKCANDPSGSPDTAFQDTLAGYDVGVDNLDAHIHPYVVFGNDGDTPSWDPTEAGIEPLSVVAVVCNNALHYGVWGDINGGVDTGEASLAMGQLCFGDDGVDANSGHSEHDVLYIAFPGADAVPGANGADWAATTKEAFEDSLTEIGDKLVASLASSNQTRSFRTRMSRAAGGRVKRGYGASDAV